MMAKGRSLRSARPHDRKLLPNNRTNYSRSLRSYGRRPCRCRRTLQPGCDYPIMSASRYRATLTAIGILQSRPRGAFLLLIFSAGACGDFAMQTPGSCAERHRAFAGRSSGPPAGAEVFSLFKKTRSQRKPCNANSPLEWTRWAFCRGLHSLIQAAPALRRGWVTVLASSWHLGH